MNGRCDVVLVSLHKTFTAADDAAISKVIDEVATTSGSYAVGIVGQSSLPSDGLTHRTERMLLNGKKINIYMSPDIFSGLLVGLLFLVTALIGACCLHSIQTPTKFNAEPLPLGKEF